MKITYEDRSEYTNRKTYRTQKYGNLLSDTYQGEVNQSSDGTWNGWFTNLSNSSRTRFKLNIKSKSAATRWVNNQLRAVGVK